MKRILYYLNAFRAIGKASLMQRLAYRLNGVLIIANLTANVIVVIALLEITFSRTNVVGDWTKPQIFLFYGVFLLIDSIFDAFFGSSLQKISDLIEDGNLDLVLTKPANALFLVSFRDFYVIQIINIIFSFLIVGYAFQQLGIALALTQIVIFIFLILSGLMIYYSIYLILATISFYTIRTPFTELLESLTGVMRFPLNIFGNSVKLLFTFVLPLIFIVTVPAQVLLGSIDHLTFIAPIVAALLFTIAIKFWKLSIKRYSSASS